MTDKLSNKLEKEVKKDVEEEVKQEIEEKLDKKLDKKLEKSLRKDIDKEVRKRLAERLKYAYSKTKNSKIYVKTKGSTIAFKKELKKHTVTAITAAFAFLIALSWRTPIQNSIDNLIDKLGLKGQAIFIEYFSAVVVTLVGVLAIMWFSRWSVKDN